MCATWTEHEFDEPRIVRVLFDRDHALQVTTSRVCLRCGRESRETLAPPRPAAFDNHAKETR